MEFYQKMMKEFTYEKPTDKEHQFGNNVNYNKIQIFHRPQLDKNLSKTKRLYLRIKEIQSLQILTYLW